VTGKSIIMNSVVDVKRLSLAADQIADAEVLTPRQIYLMGKVPGVTNVTLWDKDDSIVAIVDLKVSPDISQLKESVEKVLPEEKDVKINSTHDYVTLSGTVSNTASLTQLLALAGPYTSDGKDKQVKVLNLVEVAGGHQVMMQVRIAEISHSMLKRLGINFNYLSNSGNFGANLIGNLTALSPLGTATGISEGVNAIFRFFSSGTPWTVFIDALKEKGLLKVLAQPTLVTLSGKQANFLAGGEFPIPVPQKSGGGTTITIEYKPFGVGLNFTPTVLSNKKISMDVSTEASDLDFSNALKLSGYVVPAVTTRRVSTSIEMADGQSFAIGGLMSDNVRSLNSKFPVLGDIPVLGALFRSTSYQRNETELLVIVTVSLVKPLDMNKQTLPTDKYIPPTDAEFYLGGRDEGSPPERLQDNDEK